MKKQRGTVGGLAALLTACGTTATAVQEPEMSPTVQAECYCPDGGILGFTDVQLNGLWYKLQVHDHDCDGRYTTGELQLVVPFPNPDGSMNAGLILTPFGFWLDANEDGIAQYGELILKNNGPYTSAPGDSL